MDVGQLRPIQEHDLPIILHWRNSSRIRKSMFSDHVISWEEHVRWFQRTQDDLSAVYLVHEIGGVPVGVIHFTSIDCKSRRCMWGFYVGPDCLPKGTRFRMGCLALDYAFDSLEMRKVCGEVLACNLPSRNFHLKLGFSQEGYFQEHVLKENTYHDVVFFSLMKDHWVVKRQVLMVNALPIIPRH